MIIFTAKSKKMLWFHTWYDTRCFIAQYSSLTFSSPLRFAGTWSLYKISKINGTFCNGLSREVQPAHVCLTRWRWSCCLNTSHQQMSCTVSDGIVIQFEAWGWLCLENSVEAAYLVSFQQAFISGWALSYRITDCLGLRNYSEGNFW